VRRVLARTLVNALLVAGTTGVLLLAGVRPPLALGVGVGVGVAAGLALTRRGPVTALLYDTTDGAAPDEEGPAGSDGPDR